jgi:branched-chain amino acid transport system substrate-binding protein
MGAAGEGTLMTFPPDPRNVPAAKAVVDQFMAEGYSPEGYTLYTYAAIQAFAEAANKAKSLKVDDLSKALKPTAVGTVIGPPS